MEGQICPHCKTTKYKDPSLKLMINICGHSLCESCVNLLFLKGSGACPECNVPLRRNNFRVQMFEDPMVEKDVSIRKRVLGIYNKHEDDFETLEEYNDYLEEIETIIHNLIYNIDVINTNKRIEQYKKENRDLIARNRSKIKPEEYELLCILETEQKGAELRRQQLEQLEEENKKRKIREQEALIDALTKSREDANKIITAHAEKIIKSKVESKILPPPPKVVEFSSGIRLGGSSNQSFLPIPKLEDGPPYTYLSQEVPIEGPEMPTDEEIITKGYLANIRQETVAERAGGYLAIISCKKALQDSFQCLFSGEIKTK